MSGKILALDLGTTTIGVAVSNENQNLALGVEIIRFMPGKLFDNLPQIQAIIQREHASIVVIGNPVNMDGRSGSRSAVSVEFAHQLTQRMPNIQIALVDERLSTVEAYEQLSALGYNKKKQKDVIDMWAAKIILENYLARRKEK